jgi:cyclin-A
MWQILRMEEKMLQTLEYKLSVPTARTFLERFCMAATVSSLSDASGQDDDSIDDEECATRSKLTNLSSRVLDGTLLSFKLIQSSHKGGFLPSQLAAASILIARNSLLTTSAIGCEEGCDGFSSTCQCDWTPTLQHYTQYSKKELIPVARAILDAKVELKQRQSELIAVQKKYRHSKYGSVSTYSLLEETMFKESILPIHKRNEN